MGFNTVYKSLQNIFPEIDNRVLRAVALENRKDADAAAEVVLTKVIPHFIARSTRSTSSRSDMDAVQSPEDGDELETLNRSVHRCYTELIEDTIAVERNKKEAMLDKMQSVVNLMKTVEVEESGAEQAKKEALNSGLGILKRVEELNGELQHANEANDMHSGEVYGEKAILATEVKELQSRILSLSEQRDTSLGILDEICQNLEGRLDAAKKEKEAAEKNILETEDQAKKALAEKQLVMEKVVQEANFLKQLEEENSKLREFLLDRGHVVDILQGEISLVEEDVKLLKAKFDEFLPLSKSLSFISQTTTCNLTAASSSSPKSMVLEQVEEAIVQADPSETGEKTNHLTYVTTDYQLIDEAGLAENTTERTNIPWAYHVELPSTLDAEPTADDDNKDMDDDEWELCDI